MLSTTNPAASGIQRRRTQHRRQQSLEGPILAKPLHNPRKSTASRPTHRRGQSLDCSATAHTGFRPFATPDFPQARTPGPGPDITTTNPPDQQHFTIKQEPQAQCIAQPGYLQPPQAPTQQAFNFQSHLHQQLNGALPTEPLVNQQQAAAMEELKNHFLWYERNFGNATVAGGKQQAAPTMPVHSLTVPNTPQQEKLALPVRGRHGRSQSTQLDVAPMPMAHGGAPFPPRALDTHFQNQSSTATMDQSYAESAYSSSISDPSSPSQQQATVMPTLYEEPPSNHISNPSVEALLLDATAGAQEADFNSPEFILGGVPGCTEQQQLDAAGIDATYIDTGVSEQEINAWLEHPTDKNLPYVCKWEGCDTKVNRKENARSHVQNHLGDRRFECNPCGKRFSRMHDAKRHYLTHTQERPAVCPCGKTFARADALTRHRQRDMCEGVLPGYEKLEEERPKRGRPKKQSSEHKESKDKVKKRTKRPETDARAQKASIARIMDHMNARGANFDNIDQMLNYGTSQASDNDITHANAASPRNTPRRIVPSVNDGPIAYIAASIGTSSLPSTPPGDPDAMDFVGNDSTTGRSFVDTPPTSPLCEDHNKRTLIFDDDAFTFPHNTIVTPTKVCRVSSPAALASSLPTAWREPTPPKSHCIEPLSEEIFANFPSSSPTDPTFNFNAMETYDGDDLVFEAYSPGGDSESGASSWNSSDWQPEDYSTVIPAQQTATFKLGGSGDFDVVDDPRDLSALLDAWMAQN